ncbi:MAG: HlyD family secretion protein [Beijerinckiaceae bacterium]
MRRWLWATMTVVVLGGAGWYALSTSRSRAATEPTWRTAVVDQGSIIAAVNATGTINPTATAIVGSQVSGQVLEILADYNSNVKAGDVLARLNAEQIRAKLDAARADLAQSVALNQIQTAQIEKVKADIERAGATRADALANGRKADAILADAERTLARQVELKSRGIASEVVLQQARIATETQRANRDQSVAQVRSVAAQALALAAELKVAETQVLSSAAQIAQREAVVRQIEVDIRNSEIRSPVDGVVIQRNIELGQSVAASLQAPTLFLVAQDLSKIEIYANVDEADVGRVLTGQEVTFSVTAFPAREFSGRVKTVRLGSTTVQNVVIYTAVVEVQNSDLALRPGMTATLRIFTERRENIIRVSNAALRWRPAGEQPPAANAQPANAALPNPFSSPPGSGAAGGQGQAGGQNQQRQMLERLGAELKLDDAQKKSLEEIARAARQKAQGQGPVDTPAARRERARAVMVEIADNLKAVLRPEQQERLDAWRAEREGARAASSNGVPGRIFVVGEDGQPKAVNVRLGATDGTFTEVLSGTTQGVRPIIGGAVRGKPATTGGPRLF